MQSASSSPRHQIWDGGSRQGCRLTTPCGEVTPGAGPSKNRNDGASPFHGNVISTPQLISLFASSFVEKSRFSGVLQVPRTVPLNHRCSNRAALDWPRPRRFRRNSPRVSAMAWTAVDTPPRSRSVPRARATPLPSPSSRPPSPVPHRRRHRHRRRDPRDTPPPRRIPSPIPRARRRT